MRSSVLLVLLLTIGCPTLAARVESPQSLKCAVQSHGGGVMVSNLERRYGSLSVLDHDISRPIVFELGREGRHFRRVYPSIVEGEITFDVGPAAEFVIYPTDAFVDAVLKEVCGVAPDGLTKARKTAALASVAHTGSRLDRRARRRALEALQALLGIEFAARMEYPSTAGGDYRMYAGGEFSVRVAVSNRGSERLSDVELGLMAPDEWTVETGSPRAQAALSQGRSVSANCTVRAPARSSLRAPVSPIIATLSFEYRKRQFTIHYPFEVRLADPLVPTLMITGAHPDRIDAHVRLASTYPGRAMQRISVYPWLNTDLTIAPEDLTVDMAHGEGDFSLSYLPLQKTASYRAVTVIMKIDEHVVRLRSVMEATLDLGATTRGAALWLNPLDDGRVTPAVIDGVPCRKTSPGSKHLYFAASPNVPTTGQTHVSVTYYDAPDCSFALEYDSDRGAYTRSQDLLKAEGSCGWKTKTFTLDGVVFADRQGGKSDFRLVALDGELAIAGVTVTKFAPAEAR